MKRIKVYAKGHIRILKEGISFGYFKSKYPDAIKLERIPSKSDLKEWLADGGCESLDGCWTEPDGTCEHGLPSWLLALKYI